MHPSEPPSSSYDIQQDVLEAFLEAQERWGNSVVQDLLWSGAARRDRGGHRPETPEEAELRRRRWKHRYDTDPEFRAKLQARGRQWWRDHPEAAKQAAKRGTVRKRERRQDPEYRAKVRATVKEWTKANPEKVKGYALARKLGLTKHRPWKLEARALETVREKGSVTIRGLSDALGIEWGTAADHVRDLVARGLLTVTVGRPRLYHLPPSV